jgi:hypothetical protein
MVLVSEAVLGEVQVEFVRIEGGVEPMIEREQGVDERAGEGQPHTQIWCSSMQQVLETKDTVRQ